MPTATSRVVFEEDSIRRLRRELVLYGLIEASRQETTHYQAGKGNVTYMIPVWKLTDYGRRQLAAISP